MSIQATDIAATAAAGTFKVGLAPSFVATDFSGVNPEDCGEVPYGKYKFFNWNQGTPSANTLSSMASSEGITGIGSMMRVGNEAWGSGVTTNPASGWYWTLVVQPLDETSTATLDCRIRLEYDVTFYLRSYAGTSLQTRTLKDTTEPQTVRSVPRT
jgi:hypothetical protein